eukprot:gnl/MRDRNA2_/MRDRNA2_60127_c0_seq1.p1 gnl/MRDRNA2_/MRDRNA2_60127_c0~~gnl/MRDRNA2_/MRDRNA2_60127_c0_seq1.p1  ORF type:complete len:145 (+),score=1.20 gnl/MRDRNA2_/MRDRNA2_60127_c0_seq1:1-435(+)
MLAVGNTINKNIRNIGSCSNTATKDITFSLNSRRNLFTIFALCTAMVPSYHATANIVSDLVEKSAANKDLNDKKRLATSYANFARSRTVTDKTCRFPDNFFGCQNAAELGNVKYLTDDLKIECDGKDNGCSSKSKGTFPSFMGV